MPKGSLKLPCVTTSANLTDHERLQAWRTAMDLLAESYRIARHLPAEERYGLASQIRRAAVSIPANIAEGCGRTSPGDRLRFYSIARGSLCELGTLLAAVELLGYVEPPALHLARDTVGRTRQLLSGLSRYVRNRRAL